MDRVQFLIHPQNEEVIAYFPHLPWDRQGNLTCYAHIGQHGACSPEYAKECRPATKDEYSGLKIELESIGYKLKLV